MTTTTTKLINAAIAAVREAATLGELCDALNAFPAIYDEHGDRERVEDYVDLTSLPVYGGEEPEDTIGLYSWDEDNLLVPSGDRGFELEARPWRPTDADLAGMDIADLDDNLADDIRDDPDGNGVEYELYSARLPDAPRNDRHQHYQVLWIPAIGRAGIVFVGSGSSGHTSWTDASSPADALRRFLADDLNN